MRWQHDAPGADARRFHCLALLRSLLSSPLLSFAVSPLLLRSIVARAHVLAHCGFPSSPSAVVGECRSSTAFFVDRPTIVPLARRMWPAICWCTDNGGRRMPPRGQPRRGDSDAIDAVECELEPVAVSAFQWARTRTVRATIPKGRRDCLDGAWRQPANDASPHPGRQRASARADGLTLLFGSAMRDVAALRFHPASIPVSVPACVAASIAFPRIENTTAACRATLRARPWPQQRCRMCQRTTPPVPRFCSPGMSSMLAGSNRYKQGSAAPKGKV